MSDFETKLNSILSDPSAMAQVASLARSLQLGNSETSSPSEPAPETCPPNLLSSPDTTPAFSGLGGMADLIGKIDPDVIQKLLPLVSELSEGDTTDERLSLLRALAPFLKAERQKKIEQAVKAAKLIRVGKKLLGTIGDSHV